MDEEWGAGQEITRHCLHLPSEASAAMKAEWPKVQLACAQILRHRYDEEDRSSQNPKSEATSFEPLGEARGNAQVVRFSFTLSYALNSRRHPWPYTRKQWHQLTRFMSSLMIEPEDSTSPKTSLCELYLAYIVMNHGHCFHDEVHSDQRGGTLSSQMASFALALRSFTEITNAPSLLHPEGERAPSCARIGKYGIGQTPQLTRTLVFP